MGATVNAGDSFVFNVFGKIAIGLVTVGLVGLFGWSMKTEGKLSAINEVNLSQDRRLDGLQSGMTTPMSHETRAMLNALDHRIAAVEERLSKVDNFLLRRSSGRGDDDTRFGVVEREPAREGG